MHGRQGKKIDELPQLKHPEQRLDDARDYGCAQHIVPANLAAAKFGDAFYHDDDEPRRRPFDREPRTRQQTDQYPADNGGQQTHQRRKVGGFGNAEAQGKRQQEYDEPGSGIGRKMVF